MSRENVEVVRKLLDAANRVDVEAGLALLDPNVEWDTTAGGADGGLAKGRDQVVAAAGAWLDAWENPRIEVVRAVASQDHVVVWLVQHGSGKRSGIETEFEWAAVSKVRKGRITYYREFGASWQKALEAVGLRE
jgi:ketosteroid isomerase-like protein